MKLEPWDNPSCREFDTELFFIPETEMDNVTRNMLRTVCNGCDVYSKCFRWAIEHEEYGFWAGTEESERKVLRRRHGVKFSPITVDHTVRTVEGKRDTGGWCSLHYKPTFHRGVDTNRCDDCWNAMDKTLKKRDRSRGKSK